MFHFVAKHSRKLFRIGLLLAVVALTSGAGVYHHKTSPEHFAVVEDGVLYRSALLTPGNLNKVLDRYGIKTVVDLSVYLDPKREDLHQQEARRCREKGVVWIPLSMPVEKPPTGEQISQWLDLLKNPENHPILVHCTHGVVRTGMMVAIYEMELKKEDNRQVFSRLPTFGHEWEEEIREFILNYDPRMQAKKYTGNKAIDPV
jgi:tyrosine-protein phosphatase SIW14